MTSNGISKLWSFVNAVTRGGISPAAQALGLSQSTVSQHIQKLESDIGRELFYRDQRSFTLTPAGKQLFDTCQRCFLEMESALDGLADQGACTTLRVNCPSSLALEWMAPRLPALLAAHPSLDVYLIAMNDMLTPSSMQRDSIDVGLRYLPGRAQDSSAALAFQEYLFPVIGKGVVPVDGAAVPVFNGLTRLHDRAAWGADAKYLIGEWQLWTAANPQFAHPRCKHLGFSFAQMAYSAAANGAGVAMGRAHVLERYLRQGELVRACDVPDLPLAHYEVLLRSKHPTAPVQEFLDWLVAQMGETHPPENEGHTP